MSKNLSWYELSWLVNYCATKQFKVLMMLNGIYGTVPRTDTKEFELKCTPDSAAAKIAVLRNDEVFLVIGEEYSLKVVVKPNTARAC